MRYSSAEHEAIILNTAWEMIDGMANFELFCLPETDFDNVTILPQTSLTMRHFNILLNDFLSPVTAQRRKPMPFLLPEQPNMQNTRQSEQTFLFYIRSVCKNPQFVKETDALSQAIETFAAWLEGTTTKDVWFPELGQEIELEIERRTWIRICGDIAKHNIARLESNARKLRRIIQGAGARVPEDEIYSIFETFFENFHTDLLAYHASTIIELLNNIRWQLYLCLQEEFNRAYRKSPFDPADVVRSYHFDVPDSISHEMARILYWDLMNRCRSGPLCRPFTVTHYMKEKC